MHDLSLKRGYRTPYTKIYSIIYIHDLKWSFKTNNYPLYGSPAIDMNGTIYIGSGDFFALYPNGTKKWEYGITSGLFDSCPAVDKNGIIYIGTAMGSPTYFYAIYPNGTLKWRFQSGNIFSSPVITNDGTIIFADSDNWKIIALYQNGTKKWEFHTNMVIYSSPAIGVDGTIFCGSHDNNVYALYPNNGSLKWVFSTGAWVHGSPAIGADGTVYIGSDDGFLYALFPSNGTMKWRCNIGASYASPTIDKDGILYIGVWENQFYAIYPNGTIKWSINPGAHVWGSSAALSDDGTLYFGTCNLEWTGGIEIIALNIDGSVKWRRSLDTVFSSPAIGSDGTVYIGSNSQPGLHAFGKGPLIAEANGPYKGYSNTSLSFSGTVSGGFPTYSYHWNFGDGNTSEEQNPVHVYTRKGNFTATFTVTDSEHNSSNDTAHVTIEYALPTVEILKPENSIYLFNMKIFPFFKPIIVGRIAIEVFAAQPEIGIDRVDFYIDDILCATDTIAPYNWIWAERRFLKTSGITIVAYDTTQRSSSTNIRVFKII